MPVCNLRTVIVTKPSEGRITVRSFQRTDGLVSWLPYVTVKLPTSRVGPQLRKPDFRLYVIAPGDPSA